MTYTVTQLTNNDYEELIPFLSRAFGRDINFYPDKVSYIYKRSYGQIITHYGIKIDGKIRATLRITPQEVVVGNKTLKIAIIGNVSTDQDYRGQGLMGTLMNFAVDKLSKDGTDIGYLSGNRHRYKYFGFEIGGTNTCFYLSKQNLKQLNLKPENLIFEEVDSLDLPTSKILNEMFRKLPMHTKRKDELFFDTCTSWNRKLILVKKDRNLVGYCHDDRTQFSELAAISDEMRLAIINEYSEGDVQVCLSPADQNLIKILSGVANKQETYRTGHWQIFNYEKVLTTFLEFTSTYSKLAYGEAIFKIENTGTFKLQVSKQGISCQKVELPTENSFSRELFLKIALGPLAPCLLTELPADLQIFNNWFPLPLHCMDAS